MPRDPRLYLEDILDSTIQIKIYTAAMDFLAFKAFRKTQDAVVRNLEIIGIAAGHLSQSMKNEANDVEWRKIIGLRNILAHAYFGVSLPIIWDVVQTKLFSLESACTRLLES